jgi:hypothetical protein
MCPDLKALSAYLDGEMPPKLVERIRAHLKDCPQCQTRLERLKIVARHLTQATHPDDRYSKARVWERLKDSHERGEKSRVILWRRSVVIPFPFVALAACVIVLLGCALVFILVNSEMRTMRIKTEPSGITEIHVSAPIRDLELILGYLENQESKKETIIQLPADSKFFILGEPVLLRAKDLTRGTFK